MPELDPLPGRPRVPDFAPRTGDFDAVVGRAKHRRRRHLSTAAGAGLAGVAAVAALSMGGSGGTFGLQPVPPAASVDDSAASPSPEQSPSPEVSEPGDPQESADPGEGNGSGPGPGAGGASPEPEPEPQPEPEPTDDGEVVDEGGYQPPPPRTERPVFTRDSVAFSTTDMCQTNASFVAATGWCLGYEGPAYVQIGVPGTFRVLACRPAGRGANTLRFETEQQIEFSVSGGARIEWRWSGGYAFPKRETTVHVPEATCARWSIEWDGTGDDGDGLRPGVYTMQADVLARYSDQFTYATANGDNVEVVE